MHPYAIIYLDIGAAPVIVTQESRAAWITVANEAGAIRRPHIMMRWASRDSRDCWVLQMTSYYD